MLTPGETWIIPVLNKYVTQQAMLLKHQEYCTTSFFFFVTQIGVCHLKEWPAFPVIQRRVGSDGDWSGRALWKLESICKISAMTLKAQPERLIAGADVTDRLGPIKVYVD